MKKFLVISGATLVICFFLPGCQKVSQNHDSPTINNLKLPATSTHSTPDKQQKLKPCTSDLSCEEGFICSKSHYTGMGPNGLVTGPEEGDSKCHQLCEQNDDCAVGRCKETVIYNGDTIIPLRFCQ